MGRYKTGASTCEASKRIELSYLLKAGYLQKGKEVEGILSWTWRGESSGKIKIKTKWTDSDRYVRLIYVLENQETGEKHDYDYKVLLTGIPSNLGKGEVLYFLCPDSGKRCRILYLNYSSKIWKSREAYQNRLYYASQISSKMNYANDRYWAIERKLTEIRQEKYLHLIHNGQYTRKAQYIQALEEQQEDWDFERWQLRCMPLFLRKLF